MQLKIILVYFFKIYIDKTKISMYNSNSDIKDRWCNLHGSSKEKDLESEARQKTRELETCDSGHGKMPSLSRT